MNDNLQLIGESASMNLIAKAKELKDSGVNVIGLGGGEPDFDTPMMIKRKVIDEILKGNTHYAVGKGLPKLRGKIASKLKKDNNIVLTPDEIIVTPGAKMAIYLAVRACINPGDEVLIPTPSWVSYTEIVKSASGIPVEVALNPADNYAISASLLEQYITPKTKMIILCSPNNPTGRMINQSEIDALIEIEKDKDIVILSDEVYEKISYVDNVLSPAGFDELRDKTITVNGFSKAYAMTGWRLGYLAGSRKYIDVANKLYTHTITGTSPFIQEAAIVALDCDLEVQRMRKEYLERRDYFIGELNKIPGFYVEIPEGAFYAWCKVDLGKTDVAAELLNGANVIGVPGVAYGKGFENYIRFSFANSMEDLKEAIARMMKYMEEKN